MIDVTAIVAALTFLAILLYGMHVVIRSAVLSALRAHAREQPDRPGGGGELRG
jgi:hypothetical protein